MYLLCMQTIYFGDIETPSKWFSLARFSCFSPPALLNSTAESLLCKAHVLGFWCLHMILKASAFGKIVYIQILVKIIVIFFSDVWSLSCPNSNIFQEDFPLFVTGGNTQTDLQIGLFPSGMPSQCSFIRVGFVGLANFTLYQYPVFQDF